MGLVRIHNFKHFNKQEKNHIYNVFVDLHRFWSGREVTGTGHEETLKKHTHITHINKQINILETI